MKFLKINPQECTKKNRRLKKEKKFSLWQLAAIYSVIILLILSFFGGLFLGIKRSYYFVDLPEPEGVPKIFNKEGLPEYLVEDVDFSLFWQVWNLVREKYAEQPVLETQMFYGALAGVVASLGDPYSVFLDPELTQEFSNEMAGTFEGIGAEIAIKNNRLTIVAPLPDTPAEQAGLKAGDQVYAIDGWDTTGMALDYAVSLIRGPGGTEVILTIGRDGLEELKEIGIVRATINIESVRWEMKADNIAYIRLMHFSADTSSVFRKAAKDILEQNPQGIILDLRNNPGGYLDTAIDVASEWIKDDVVVVEKFQRGRQEEYRARGRAQLNGIPAVVLVNEGSASGSEIVAGALQDYELATIVGETTFGKGSVQQLEIFSDGSSVKLTVAKWLTPLGRVIEEAGIIPDVIVELTSEDFDADLDPQMNRALEILTKW